MKVTLKAPDGCTIAYTTNGAIPTAADDTKSSELEVALDAQEPGYLIEHRDLMMLPDYDGTFILEDSSLPSGTVVRAAAMDKTGNIGESTTRVYFPNIDFAKRFPGCLVVSIVTDPTNLLDYETGILATGATYDAWRKTPEADTLIAKKEYWEFETNSTQEGKAWERPCTVQLYDGNGAPAIEQNAGIRITGGYSRSVSQKSFNVYFRDEYGSKWFDYELFDGTDRYRNFRLKAGGNNTEFLKFKDEFLLDLLSDGKYTMAQSRKAVLFLNGEYWGCYILSEKPDSQMLSNRYGVDKDQVVIMKAGEVDEGVDEDILLYNELMSYAEKDLADPATWQEFCNIMDIESMVDNFAARIYIGDGDWKLGSNDVFWRTRDTSYNGGRWQYILYDVEYSSGLYGQEKTSVGHDHIQDAIDNFPLFGAALRNQEFRNMFVDKLKQVGSKACNPQRVERLMKAYVDEWKPLMSDCYKRYGDKTPLWNNTLQQTLEFFEKRYDVIVPIAEALE